jgi:pimeloyl-ACP methyl ester carboxylesterase
MSEIKPFTVAIPQSALDDLNARLDMTRWPEKEAVDDWTQGAPLAEVRALADYWRNGYDWRSCEARLNALPQFTTTIDGLEFYFIHLRSPHENAAPLVLTHGWPGSVLEFLDAIPRLVDPVSHGGKAEDAFHVVVPALPGFGFSGKPEKHGWGTERIARAWGVLMARLGYSRWFAQGGDWGSLVTTHIATQQVEGCAGIHVNLAVGAPPPEVLENPDEEAARVLAKFQYYWDWDCGYSTEQKTRPQTIGYSLVDSPVGQLAWIFEKMWAWTDNEGSPYDALTRDQILDNVMLYWLTASGASSARLYWQSMGEFQPHGYSTPCGVSLFPKEIFPTPKAWLGHIEQLVYFNELPKGGHFAAWEQPEIFAQELRACFALMR